MSQVPSVGFDTSVLNAFEEAGVNSEPLMCALQIGFAVNVFAINIDEIIATPNPMRREALVTRCVRLLASGQCLWPHHWIVQLLIREYRKGPDKFDWRRVNVRATTFEQALIRRNYTDQVCAEQRCHQFAMEKDYAKTWNALRPKLAPVLAKLKTSRRPANFLQAVRIAEQEEGVLWSIGAELYNYATAISVSEDEVRAFMAVCPPFRAVCYAQVGTWFDRALRPSVMLFKTVCASSMRPLLARKIPTIISVPKSPACGGVSTPRLARYSFRARKSLLR